MTERDADTQLRHQARVVRGNILWIILITVLAVAIAFAFTFQQEERFTAGARLLVESEADQDVDLATEAQRVASVPVAEIVIDDLDLTGTDPNSLLDGLNVSPIEDEGAVLAIVYTSTDAAQAASISNGFAESYLEYRGEQALGEATEATDAITGLIETTQSDLDSVIGDIATARGQGDADEIEALESERDTLAAQLAVFQQRLADARLAGTVGVATGEVLAGAVVPSSPSQPDYQRDLLFAGLAGLAVGLAIAFFRSRLEEPV
ncbi:MAG TPA: Wzz/FepE/Etk N-terminal domain-containing protein [Actinomycetota bacterium]|nr:Wzz/FepE/Etk N-terminal domain-containing protein [Actinomycetota bacterium]